MTAAAFLVAMAPAAYGQSWVPEGPGPTLDGQVEGIAGGEVVGAVQAIAAHPTDPDILYAGGVNGGIWKTSDATSASPSWVFQTPDAESLSIAVLEFDPGDPQTLLAGVGRRSSFGGIGGSRTGLLRTVDGGANWVPIAGGMAGRNVLGVAARSATLVAAVDVADAFICDDIGIFRSTDSGASWAQISESPGSGLPGGTSDELAGDPADPARLFTSVVFTAACSESAANGIYRSFDTGATWTKVSSPAMDALLLDSTGTHVRIAVGPSDSVAVAIVPATGRLGGIFHSGDGGASWAAMDLPGSDEQPFEGIHPGGQGGTHLSLAIDPSNGDLIYIGGDRQPLFMEDVGGSFPNTLGASDFSGRLFRGDASAPPGSQWVHLTHDAKAGPAGGGTASNSAPHADSRDMAFDAAGNLLESDDGGVYKRTSPGDNSGDWFSLNGDIQTTELHDAAYDPVSDILIGGAQDTGTPQQLLPGESTWESVSTADGGDVVVDGTTTPGLSTRYSSNQNLGGFRRRIYDADNMLVAQVFPPLAVVLGAPIDPQFVTPLALNNVTPTRLVVGADNGVYESMDQGDTAAPIANGIDVLGFGRDTLAYGAADNEDVLYVGGCIGDCSSGIDGPDGVFVRSAAGNPVAHAPAYPGALPRGLEVDPDQGARAFVIDNAGAVYHTADTGASWSDVTGNLGSFSPGTLRSVEYLARDAGDAVVAGADRGVYLATEADGFAVWSDFSGDLPSVPVFDLDYHAPTDRLVAGTLGRGAFSTGTLQATIFSDGFESGDTSAWSATVPAP